MASIALLHNIMQGKGYIAIFISTCAQSYLRITNNDKKLISMLDYKNVVLAFRRTPTFGRRANTNVHVITIIFGKANKARGQEDLLDCSG